MAAQGGMGLSPLYWSEIRSYDLSTGNTLGIWAKKTIRQMSESYCLWYSKGGKQNDIATDVPYVERNEETMQAAVRAMIASRDAARVEC